MLGSLFGKEKKLKKDPLADSVNNLGKQGLSTLTDASRQLNDSFYDDPSNYARTQVDIENNAIRRASQDAEKRTQQLLSQRGMGNSSIGLGQQINQRQSLNERLGLNNASVLDRTKGLLNEKLQMGQNLFNVKASQGPMRMEDVSYKTDDSGMKILSGGLSLLGAGLGNYFGSKAGAAAKIGGK